MGKFVILLSLALVVLADDEVRKPVYKYRYETEDVMKTAASTIPVHGYHVVEGGYYPGELGIGAGGVGIGGVGGGIGGGGIGLGYGGYGGGIGAGKLIGGAGLIGAGGGLGYGAGLGAGKFIGGAGLYGGGAGIGGAGLYGGGAGIGGGGLIGGGAGLVGGGAGLVGGGAGLIGGGGYIGGPLIHGYGGEVVDKNIYSGEKKNLNDEAFEKASGKKGEEFNAGKEGFSKGVAAIKNNKGESAYFNEGSGGKKLAEDGKAYYGGQHFDKEGKHGGEFNEKKGHKKGHVIKGFKSSHHKDETGKTEEYYDEENDEGGKVNFNGEAGSFGEKGASSFKGGHENGEFAQGGHKKQGHFDNEHFVDNSNAGHGNFGEKKYGGSGAVYGVNNGVDQHSLLGHQENSKFFKHIPHHVPFY